MDLRRLATIAAGQHGLITRAQVGTTDPARRAWYRAIRRGDLEQLHTGVARLHGHAVTREQRILAAVLALRQGPARRGDVMASHRSAAYLLGLDRPVDDPVDVIVVGVDRRRRLDGVVIHRPTVLHDLTPPPSTPASPATRSTSRSTGHPW